jgi:hypothetical protein
MSTIGTTVTTTTNSPIKLCQGKKIVQQGKKRGEHNSIILDGFPHVRIASCLFLFMSGTKMLIVAELFNVVVVLKNNKIAAQKVG